MIFLKNNIKISFSEIILKHFWYIIQTEMRCLTMERITNIGIWGDSILKGVILDESDGRYKQFKQSAVNLFKRIFNTTVDIKNNSRFGCTAPKAQKNLNMTLRHGYKADVVLLEFGGNDCDFNWAEVSSDPDGHHEPNTPPRQFEESMRGMVNILLKHDITPVLMNLPPIDSELYFNHISCMDGVDGENVLRWLREKNVIYRQQESYSHRIEKIAHEYNLHLIDVREPFLEIRDYKTCLCGDGIHLNKKGQKILGKTFSDYAQKYISA